MRHSIISIILERWNKGYDEYRNYEPYEEDFRDEYDVLNYLYALSDESLIKAFDMQCCQYYW